MTKSTPEFKTMSVDFKDRTFELEYFLRRGNAATLIMIHGLGGCKENYLEACKSDALATYTLICFDNPGTGNSTYFEDLPLNVDDLAAITTKFINQLDVGDFILCGTSMGGLTTLLYLKSSGGTHVKAYINIEGNLMPEDCIFSSKVIRHEYDHFRKVIFPLTIRQMKQFGNTGYHIIANNLELNTNVASYYNYSFQTVEYSANGNLLNQFIEIKIPRIFIYGERNRSLSYIPELLKTEVKVKEISESDHFVFYDNPKELYDVIGSFVKDQL